MPNTFSLKKINYIILGLVCILTVINIIIFSILSIQKINCFNSLRSFSALARVFHNIVTGGQIKLFDAPCSVTVANIKFILFGGPIVFLYCFIYFLFPYFQTLLIAHTFFMYIGALPLYLLTKRVLKNIPLALLFSISFLLHPFVNYQNLLGFGPHNIGLPILFLIFYFLEKGDFRNFIIFVILGFLIRAHVGLSIILFGLYLMTKIETRRYGKTSFLIGIIWIPIIVSLALFFSGITGKDLFRLFDINRYLGETLYEKIHIVLNNPSLIIQNLIRENIPYYFLLLFLPLAFIPLFYPALLFPAIFSFGFMFLVRSRSSVLYNVIPFIYLSGIYGAKRIINFMEDNPIFNRLYFTKILSSKPELIITILILTTSIFSHYYLTPQDAGPIPLTNGFNANYYRINAHHLIGHKLLNLIPKESSCIAQDALIQHLTNRKKLDTFRDSSENEGWEYVLLDVSKVDFRMERMSPEDYYDKVDRLLKGNIYGVLSYEDGWLLLKNNYNQSRNKEASVSIRQYR